MTKTANNLKDAILSVDAIALDLETVPREPDSMVDRVIKNLRKLSVEARRFTRESFQSEANIKGYFAIVTDAAVMLDIVKTDTPDGTVKSASTDLKAVAEYMLGCINEKMKPRPVTASIQVPPRLHGEPADALDKPARRYSAEDQARIDAGLKPFAPPQPTAEEKMQPTADAIVDLLHQPATVKKDASKGESIVQACAQIRGEIANNLSGQHAESAQAILGLLRNIEDQAFAKDTPDLALHVNISGNPLDDEQVELISRIKTARRELISLANSTKNYLLAKQKRLRATCDANPCHDVDHELTEAQAAAYKAYTEFCDADGYGWLDRGVSDVQVGVMSIIRAVSGPTE